MAKKLIILLCASLFIVSCAHGPKRERRPASEPETGLRVYMQLNNCKVTAPTILRFLTVPSPMRMTPGSYDKESFNTGLVGLEARLKSGETVKGYGPNPYLSVSERTGKMITSCMAHFFIDMPKSFSPAEIMSIKFLMTDITARKEQSYEIQMPAQWALENFDPSQPLKTIDYPSSAGEKYRIVTLHGSQKPENAWDLVFLGDGFSASELSLNSDEEVLKSKFGLAAIELKDTLFQYEPYKSLRDHINVKLVATVSKDSGIQRGTKGIRLDTFYSAATKAYCTERSFVVRNAQRALEMGSLANADSILVILNTEQYGGQGSFISTSSLNPNKKDVFIHELGHSLAGLSDGYSYSVRSVKTQAKSERQNMVECDDLAIGQAVIHDSAANIYNSSDPLLSGNVARSAEEGRAKWGVNTAEMKPQLPSEAYLTEGSRPDMVKLVLKFDDVKADPAYLTAFSDSEVNKKEALQTLWINGQSAKDFAIKTVALKSIHGNTPFNYLEIPKPASGKIEVVTELAKEYEPQLRHYTRPSNTGYQLVDRAVAPQELIPVEMDRGNAIVYRSSFASAMTAFVVPGIDFDEAEKETIRAHVCAYIKDRASLESCYLR
jgi:hypothetical protein